MSLREEAVEAMARVYFDEVGRRSGVTLAFETAYDEEQADFKYVAGLALDGLVAYLRENDETWMEAGQSLHKGPHPPTSDIPNMTAVRRLLAVLEGDS